MTLDNELQISILGDPHMGRIFKTGVPLHRLGDRENQQLATLQESLNHPIYRHHVCLGDLFDKFRVSNEVVLQVATCYEVAAEMNPDVTYIILQGNHDNTRDDTKVSSFSIFQRLLAHIPNIKVLTGSDLVLNEMLFIPWSPWKTAEESLAHYVDAGRKFDAVFVHWDTGDYGNEDAEHVLPIKTVSQITNTVIMGHQHKPSLKTMGGVRVCTWGSMLPYAHGEEAEPDIYLTHTVGIVENNLEKDLNFYQDKCLRVLLESTEKPLAGIECLALTHKRVGQNTDIELDVSVDEFSLHSVLKQTFDEFGVPAEITQEISKQI
jgi:DNA repair exonuclease SbcCD nuclease subunit